MDETFYKVEIPSSSTRNGAPCSSLCEFTLGLAPREVRFLLLPKSCPQGSPECRRLFSSSCKRAVPRASLAGVWEVGWHMHRRRCEIWGYEEIGDMRRYEIQGDMRYEDAQKETKGSSRHSRGHVEGGSVGDRAGDRSWREVLRAGSTSGELWLWGTNTGAGTPQGTLTHRGPRLEQGMSEEEGEGEEKSKKPGMAARNHHVLTQPPVKTGWGRAGGREVLDWSWVWGRGRKGTSLSV